MFAWIKSLFRSNKECDNSCSDLRLTAMEATILQLMDRDGYVTKDSFFKETGMKLHWLQKCAKSMKELGYNVGQQRTNIQICPGHLGGSQVRWYFTK